MTLPPKPKDFTTEASRSELDRHHLFRAVENGVKGKEMPAWKWVLSKQQIADIVEYVYREFIDSTTSGGPKPSRARNMESSAG